MEEIKELIKHVAPSLGAALDSPFTDIATKYITDTLIVDEMTEGRKTEEVLKEKLREPDHLHKLKIANKAFESEMKKLGIDIFTLGVNHKNIIKDSQNMDNKLQFVLSIIFFLAYFGMIAALFFVEVSDSMNMKKGENSLMGELQILFGVLTAGVGQILSFWFSNKINKER